MIRLTVLYNLPPGTDEDEFLRWRLGEHQASNESGAGVLRTDFGLISERWTPEGVVKDTPFRFMTVVDYPDRESFEKGFLSAQSIAKLNEDRKRITDTQFLISEILASSEEEV
ncbi:MAG: hypothetical protein R3E39_27270 [Anaerolineae bacterium]